MAASSHRCHTSIVNTSSSSSSIRLSIRIASLISSIACIMAPQRRILRSFRATTVLHERQIQKEKTFLSWTRTTLTRTTSRGGTAEAPLILTSTSKVGSAVLRPEVGKGQSGCQMDMVRNTLRALRRRARI